MLDDPNRIMTGAVDCAGTESGANDDANDSGTISPSWSPLLGNISQAAIRTRRSQ